MSTTLRASFPASPRRPCRQAREIPGATSSEWTPEAGSRTNSSSPAADGWIDVAHGAMTGVAIIIRYGIPCNGTMPGTVRHVRTPAESVGHAFLMSNRYAELPLYTKSV